MSSLEEIDNDKQPKLKILDKPKLKNVKMNCDHILHPKLLDYEMTADCFSLNHFTIIAGVMRAGKTTLMTTLVKDVFNKVYENIYVFMPSTSRMSMNKDIFAEELPPEHLYEDLTAETLEKIYDQLQENTEEKWNSLLIIDDFQSHLKNKEIVYWLHKIITRIRHLRVSVILLQQNFQKLHKSLRELASNLILFDLGKSQLLKVFDEVVPVKKDRFYAIANIAFDRPHDWMCINTGSKRIYRMFDEIEY